MINQAFCTYQLKTEMILINTKIKKLLISFFVVVFFTSPTAFSQSLSVSIAPDVTITDTNTMYSVLSLSTNAVHAGDYLGALSSTPKQNAYLFDRSSIEIIDSLENLSVGLEAFGGVIFHLDKSGKHGMVVSLENIGGDLMKYKWGCHGVTIEGANGIKLGLGRMNTLAISTNCDDKFNAAQVCLDYQKDEFKDWYLPSLEELEKIATNLGKESDFTKLVNFDICFYLSSSQLKNKKHKMNYAWAVNLYDNETSTSFKSNEHKIRAIRNF